ncbi:hypothetical protein KQX54_020572 [Cotesia glomerata]|uniref:Uncharacterized protein n=1 Tax=Cotesia glomerata TaxID=32391 RepID=A0AAV7J830_COTGL|nr:hypothetical protein KQX54_020572 [Cotesia glomerata]
MEWIRTNRNEKADGFQLENRAVKLLDEYSPRTISTGRIALARGWVAFYPHVRRVVFKPAGSEKGCAKRVETAVLGVFLSKMCTSIIIGLKYIGARYSILVGKVAQLKEFLELILNSARIEYSVLTKKYAHVSDRPEQSSR